MPRQKGYKHTIKSIEKMRQAKMGHKVSQVTRDKIRKTLEKSHVSWNRGTKGKGICKANSGSFKKGLIPWISGRKHTKEARLKMSMAVRKSKRWNGGKTKRYGYILLWKPEHPYSISGYIREQRFIMEKHLGRYLKSKEIVHHINGIKTDNRINNLLLLPNKGEHTKIHNELRRKHANSLLCM